MKKKRCSEVGSYELGVDDEVGRRRSGGGEYIRQRRKSVTDDKMEKGGVVWWAGDRDAVEVYTHTEAGARFVGCVCGKKKQLSFFEGSSCRLTMSGG